VGQSGIGQAIETASVITTWPNPAALANASPSAAKIAVSSADDYDAHRADLRRESVRQERGAHHRAGRSGHTLTWTLAIILVPSRAGRPISLSLTGDPMGSRPDLTGYATYTGSPDIGPGPRLFSTDCTPGSDFAAASAAAACCAFSTTPQSRIFPWFTVTLSKTVSSLRSPSRI
jgi:hypothetical protein